MVCKNRCDRYKATQCGFKNQRYVLGQKRCNTCQVFVIWDGVYCPCCGYKLRAKPRRKETKERMRKMKALEIVE